MPPWSSCESRYVGSPWRLQLYRRPEVDSSMRRSHGFSIYQSTSREVCTSLERQRRIHRHKSLKRDMGVYKLIKSDDRVAAAPSAEPNKLVLAVVDDVLLSPHRDIEAGTKHSHEAPPEKEASAAGKRGPRLLSLDVFRGLTVAVCEPLPPHCLVSSLFLSAY
ncbi:hypothetical protein BHE74_00009663 [Ensete ventricosum]|nr:hypothetical protein BHE74_00009663 [Ensete ventricosum]